MFSRKTNIGFLICLMASLLLTHHEIECKEKEKEKIKLLYLNFLQFIHHFLKLVAFTAPFFITEKYLLIVTAIGLSYVFIQNIYSYSKKQPCILSIYVNKECKQDEDEYLRDVIYHTGFKNNKYYPLIFNIYTLFICIWLWYLILNP